MRLFDELKRRNVFKVGAAYLALAWAVVEVTGTVAPMFDLPPWIGRAVVWIGVAGLPFALLFAWVYELTPDGLRRSDEVAPAESVTDATGRKLQLAIAVLLAIAIAVFVLDRFVIDRARAPAAIAATAPASPPVTPATPRPAAAARPSIAVLPFEDMSQARDQEYFADGLSEELLNLLAQLPQLRVIARTSSFSFKDKDADVATIAKSLGVDHVLEGSVRKSGDTLRITAQLIRASDSSHLWSQTYDRKVTDVFKLQDEIAAAVVDALKVQLLPSQSFAEPHRTANSEAYNQFLLGTQYYRRQTAEGFKLAVAAFTRAVALDPSYAAAYARLSIAEMFASDYAASAAAQEAGRQRAIAAAARALELDPQLAEGYAARARLRSSQSYDWAGALADLQKALALDPANVRIRRSYGNLLGNLGRTDEAIAELRAVVDADPLAADSWDVLGYHLMAARQPDAANAALLRSLELNPESSFSRVSLGQLQLLNGDAQAALESFDRSDAFWRRVGRAMALHTLGDATAADRELKELIAAESREAAYQIAEVYAWRGDTDQAFEWLDRAYAQQDGGLELIVTDPALESLRGDPRYTAMLRKLGLSH